MTPPVRKLALTVHVTASVGWAGALAVFLAHALASSMSQNDQIVRAAAVAMGLTAWLVILPLSIASLVSGLVQAFGTAWGLLRHYWVLFKLLLTGIATGVLLVKLQPISHLADTAVQAGLGSGDLIGLRTSLAVHAAGGLVVLLAAAALAIYKPEGRIGAGRAPSWARAFRFILGGLVLVVVVMAIFGAHGPGAH